MTDWTDLAKIADAIFERDLGAMSKIAHAENRLKEKRRKLEALNTAALSELRHGHACQQRDGDVLWQAWVGRNKRDMGIEQARLRALREIYLPRVRKAYGRKVVIETLARTQDVERN